MPTWIDFWNSLGTTGKVFLCFALPSSLVLVIHTLSTLMGLDHESDFEGIEAGSDTGDHDVPLFTLRNFEAFFSMFGWGGLLALERGMSTYSAVLVGSTFGFVSSILMVILMRSFYKLQQSGTYDPSSVVGKTATVYITIPKKDCGYGKINVEINGIIREYKAISLGDALENGSIVKIVSCLNNFFIVERSI